MLVLVAASHDLGPSTAVQSARSDDRHSMSRTPGAACRDVPKPKSVL